MSTPRSKKNFPKWIPPEKRMKKYKDFGYTDENNDLTKVKWCEFIIVCASEEDRAQIRAAMEYFHDMKELDTDFVVANQLVHNYIHDDSSDAHTDVIVDAKLYKKLKPRKHVDIPPKS